MSVSPHTVLLIEDNPGDARLIREMLAEDPAERFRLHCADRLSRGLDFLSSEKTGLVLLDLSLPDSHGLETFAKVFAHSPQIPIIVLTGNDDVNDSLGHRVGDELLKCVGQRLKLMLREGDTVARLGGDEFVLILNDQTHQDVMFRVMQRICSKVAEPSIIQGKELYVTCSAGISLYPQDGRDVDTLLKNADAAMYRAKEHGRNNFQFYTAEMNEMVNERLALEQNLRQALERGEFALYYQPIVSLKNDNIVGAEALLRWRHPERGLMLPERFIHLAEETGLIVPIGEWALREACVQNRAWQKEGLRPITVSVNVSARQFRHDVLVNSVSRILAESGLDPSYLDMELTESIIMHDARAAIATLRELKALGVSLSIDDFGTGYSSLSYLKDLPIDTLKIDRAFVRDITESQSDNRVLARAIVSLGHGLGLKVVAEGVGNKVQLDFLRKHHCDEVQGFYFSEPVPPEEFRKLRKGNWRKV